MIMPAGQDYGNRWQWVDNARPEAGRLEVVVIQQGGRQWQRTRRLAPGALGPLWLPGWAARPTPSEL